MVVFLSDGPFRAERASIMRNSARTAASGTGPPHPPSVYRRQHIVIAGRRAPARSTEEGHVPLHPEVEAMRARREREQVAPLYTLSLAEARAADLAEIQAAAGDAEPVRTVEELTIATPDARLPARIYRPGGEAPMPLLIYFFGGGWTLGTIDTCDTVCRRLANAVGCAVLAASYRLAPEHKFPTAVHDCHAALSWARHHAAEIDIDADRIAVGGDSAGGNLAAAVTLLARDDDVDLAGQLLVYPNTDYLADTPSRRDNQDPHLFNSTSVHWYWDNYLARPEDGANPLASPLRAADLRGLPAALVITAEFDPLRDEAEMYAQRLREAGVPVEMTRYDGMAHGFFCLAGELTAGARAQDQAAAFLRDRLAVKPDHE
jgi:acetyl esterase